MESDDRLKELSLYIAEKSKDDPSFGAIKLNKILFATDFYFYGFTGRAITEAKYVHRNNGPVPRRMPLIIESLKTEGRAKLEDTTYFGYSQKRLVPLMGANTSMFNEGELSFVDQIISHFRSYNGTQLSKWTHDLSPWLATEDGEEIPYCSVFVLNPLPVEKAGISWAMKELTALGKV